jgi:hypothetical protein
LARHRSSTGRRDLAVGAKFAVDEQVAVDAIDE